MIFTLILVGFLSSFVFIYIQELTRLYHKLNAIPGVNLLVPLVVVSCLIELYEEWVHWLLLYSQAKLHNFLQVMAGFLPFEQGSLQVVRIAFLFFLACFPIFWVWFKAKRRGLIDLPVSSYYLSVVLWLLAVFLFVSGPL